MTLSLAQILLMVVVVVGIVGFSACIHLVRTERANGEYRVATDLGTRIGRHGIWVGAWLVTIPTVRARQLCDEAKTEAAKQAPPERVLELWWRAGARLLAHIPGPEVTTEAEACGWLEHASDDLARTAGPSLEGGDRRSVFALVYACVEPPPTRPVGFNELRERLLGPACVGAAFVACLEGARGGRGHRAPLRAVHLAQWGFFSATVAGLACGATSMIWDEPSTAPAIPGAETRRGDAWTRPAAATNAAGPAPSADLPEAGTPAPEAGVPPGSANVTQEPSPDAGPTSPKSKKGNGPTRQPKR
jgi:hypothetical protein